MSDARINNLASRFWSKVAVGDPDACWIWLASKRCGSKYGSFALNRTTVLAHRTAFTLSGGKTTKTKPFVLHRCNNEKCCNPRHLYAGSREDNARDAILNGWDPGKVNRQKRRCPSGHEYFFRKDGKRSCRECSRSRDRRRYQSRRAYMRRYLKLYRRKARITHAD